MESGKNYLDYKNNGMSLGGEMPYGVMASDMNQPQPYGMMAPQQPYGGMDMSQPYGGSQLPGTQPTLGSEGDTSMFEPTDDSPLPNFDKYMDAGLAAGQAYRDVSGDGMSIAQMRQLSQRGQPQYQDFMGGGSGYSGLPYGLLGG